jgi:hypothetical protein
VPFKMSMEEKKKKKRNDRNFEDHERTLKEISLYFSSLYISGQLLMFLLC